MEHVGSIERIPQAQGQLQQGERAGHPPAMHPYPPSWLDRLHEQVERLPGPAWLIYGVLALMTVVVHAAIKWRDGSYPVGIFQPFHVVVMVSGFWYLALIHYLNWAAKQAIVRFRPAMDGSKSNLHELVYALLNLPDRPTLAATVAGGVYGLLMVAGVAGGLIFTPKVQVFTSPLASWFEGAIGLLVCVAFVLFIYHTIHQVRVVNRIYTTATVIDLFNLTPVYALSVLTAQTASGGILVAYAWIATEPGAGTDKFSLAALLITIILALVTFLYPLLGVRRLLIIKKEQAQAAAGARIKACRAALHSSVDSQLLADLQGQVTALNALQQEQEWLAKIPTWPWKPETLRGLATAILLPVALWFINRLLEQWFRF